MNIAAFVYILANKKNGTIYIGMTDNLIKRTYEHKNEMTDGFTKKYQVHNLVYYEVFDRSDDAFKRERQLKKWHRAWKIALIEKKNPSWKDLYNQLNK